MRAIIMHAFSMMVFVSHDMKHVCRGTCLVYSAAGWINKKAKTLALLSICHKSTVTIYLSYDRRLI